mmetsp:Transcript_93772/g.286925  ORF Transcript_93772/g.286925 Transcript_93772/m.286925 type:complete len:453 (-) Transcript_93772:29-1387(-)
MRPGRPQHGLAEERPFLDELGILLRLRVAQAATQQEEHSGIGGGLHVAEQDILRVERQRGHRHVADLAHPGRVDVVVAAHEGVREQDPAVHLEVHLHEDRLADDLEQLHAGLRGLVLLLEHGVRRVPLDAHREGPGDVVVDEEATQRRDLRRALAVDDLQAGHRRRDLPDDRGGQEERQEEHAAREKALPYVVREQQGRVSGQGGDRPMEGPGVPLPQGLFGDVHGLDPRDQIRGVVHDGAADAVPQAGKDVRRPQEEHHDLADAGDQAQLLAHGDVLAEVVGYLRGLQQPEQAHGADHPQTAQRRPDLVEALILKPVGERLRPVHADNQDVQRQPGHRVVPGHVLRSHLDHAVVAHVADEKRQHHVHGPKDPDEPRHRPAEVRTGRVQQLHRHRDAVVADQHQAREVPDQVGGAARVHHVPAVLEDGLVGLLIAISKEHAGAKSLQPRVRG